MLGTALGLRGFTGLVTLISVVGGGPPTTGADSVCGVEETRIGAVVCVPAAVSIPAVAVAREFPDSIELAGSDGSVLGEAAGELPSPTLNEGESTASAVSLALPPRWKTTLYVL